MKARTTDRTMPSSYNQDFALWASQQAALLRQGQFDALDIANLAEEIEALAKRDRRELESRIRTILIHKMKLDTSTAQEPRAGWLEEIRENQAEVEALLKDSPSLEKNVDGFIQRQTTVARLRVKESLEQYQEKSRVPLNKLLYDRHAILPFLAPMPPGLERPAR